MSWNSAGHLDGYEVSESYKSFNIRFLHRPSASKVLQDHYAHSGHYNQKYHVDELLQIRNQALGLVPQKLEIRVFYPSLVPFC